MEKKEASLSEIQQWMQGTLIKPREKYTSTEVGHYISEGKNITAVQCLGIYQRSYYSRLVECMRSQFKALHYTLGDLLFEDFVRMYLQETPSASPSLSQLGERFPVFLQENRPDKNAPELWIDFMIAMAQFECDLYEIFDREGSEGKEKAVESTLDEQLQLNSCFKIVKYPFRVNLYYQEVAQGNKPEITPEEETYIVFLRVDYQVFIVPVTAQQFLFLEIFQREKNISKAKKGLIQKYGLSEDKINELWKEWKKEWIEKGFFYKKCS